MKYLNEGFWMLIQGRWRKSIGKSFEGSQGCYVKYSKNKGVKIILNDLNGKYCNITSEEELMNHPIWWETQKEYEYLNQSYKSSITPKVYLITAIKINNLYYPGIVMQHIQGDPLYIAKPMKKLKEQVDKYGKILSYNNIKNGIPLLDFIKKTLKKFKIQHLDLNSSNILVTKSNKIKVIDFGLAKKIK